MEEESLEEQEDRHPLVVKNHLSSVALPLLSDVFLGRHIVRVSYPAVVVGVILVVLREHRRYPAVDRLANELHLADDHRERNQNARRVFVVQTIREVIVVAGLLIIIYMVMYFRITLIGTLSMRMQNNVL